VGRIVIVAYRPKPGKDKELLALTREHHGILAAQDLVTAGTPVIARASDGTIVEVFEWKSADAINQAHENPAVQGLWARYAALCDYVPLSQLPETTKLFAEFDSTDEPGN
jgi:quinol monooxygenase YgiN